MSSPRRPEAERESGRYWLNMDVSELPATAEYISVRTPPSNEFPFRSDSDPTTPEGECVTETHPQQGIAFLDDTCTELARQTTITVTAPLEHTPANNTYRFSVVRIDPCQTIFTIPEVTLTRERCGDGQPTVTCDIMPGNDTNAINPRSRGVVPVAILTTDDFDATTVNPATLRFGSMNEVFGGGGARLSHGSGHTEDVDGDGDVDFLGHFPTQDTGFSNSDTEGWLVGATMDGELFACSDSVTIKSGGSS